MSQIEKDSLINEIQKLKLICNQYDEGDGSISYNDNYSEIIENVYNANLDRDDEFIDILAYINLTLGNMAYGDGNYEMSLEHYNASSNFYHKLDDKENLANAVQGITDSYYMLEKYSKVMEYNPIVMNYYKQKGEKSNEANAAYYSADSKFRLKDYDEALVYAHQALVLYKQINDEENQAYTTNLIGRINFYIDNNEETINYYLKTIELRKNAGIVDFLADDYINLGDAYYYADKNKKAKKAYLKAHEYNDRNYDAEQQKSIYKNLTNVCYYLDEEEETIEYGKKTVELYDSEENQHDLIEIYSLIGDSYYNQEKYSKAITSYSEAEWRCSMYFEDTDDLVKKAKLNVSMYDCCYQMGQYENGILFLEKAIEINEENKNIIALAENYYELALVFHRGLKDQEKSFSFCIKALDELYENRKDPHLLKGKIWELLGDITPKFLLHRNMDFLIKYKIIENIAEKALKIKIREQTLKFYLEAISCYSLADEPDKKEIVKKKISIVEEDLR